MELPSKKWHIKHSSKAVKKLGQTGDRFCKAQKGQKRPVGDVWQEKENTFVRGNEELTKWIRKGRNYGVAGTLEGGESEL